QLGASAARVAATVVETLRAMPDGPAPEGPLPEGVRPGMRVLRGENSHLLDEASSQVIDWIARHEDVPVVVSTRRSAATWSPWLGLWRDDALERVDIEPLDFPQTEGFLVAELGGPITADTAHRLWRLTGGNVFYL